MNARQRVEFQRELELIRRKQFAISSRSTQAVLQDLAVLVGNPAVGQAAALAIACLHGGKREETLRLVEALQQCAARITLAQGLSYDRRPIL
jgi:DNA-binding IclR family transcriptional regulator